MCLLLNIFVRGANETEDVYMASNLVRPEFVLADWVLGVGQQTAQCVPSTASAA